MLDYLFTKTPLAFLTQNLWRDEAFSYLLAQEPVQRIVELTAGDFSPPLYYLVLHYWTMIFGSNEIAIRSLSFMLWVFTLYIVYEILVDVFKFEKIKTVVFLLLFLLNPFLNYYASEARMYMMVTFFLTLSYYALWMNHKKTYMISMVLALYTHYFALFIFAAQWLPRLFTLVKDLIHKKHTRPFWRHTLDTITTPLLITLAFVPWALYMFSHHNFGDSDFWIIKPPRKELFYIPFLLYTGYERVFGEYYHEKAGYTDFHNNILILLYLILLIPLVLKYLLPHLNLKLFKHHTHDKSPIKPSVYVDVALWALMAPVAIFILSYITQPLFHPRYYIFASVGFGLLIVLAFNYLWKYQHIAVKAVGIGLFVLLIQWTWSFTQLNLQYRSKRNIKPIVQEVAGLARSQDEIYTHSELDYHLIQYYLRDKKDKLKIYGKTYTEIPAYVGKVLIPESALAYDLPFYPQKAFLIKHLDYVIYSAY